MKNPKINSVEVLKCTCGAGDTETLRVLRATSLADTSVPEFNEIVNAVNKSGGIAQTTGLWRMLISKAIKEHRDGFEKGDFVGHPFRGNQHSDSSGASRGGAGGSRTGSSSAGGRGRNRDQGDSLSAIAANSALEIKGKRGVLFDGLKMSVTANFSGDAKAMKLLGRAEAYGIDTNAGKDALSDLFDYFEDENQSAFAEAAARVINPRMRSTPTPAIYAEARSATTARLKDSMETAIGSIARDRDGISNLVSASRMAIDDAVARADQSDSYGEDNDSGDRDAVSFIRRAEDRVMKLAMRVSTALSSISDEIGKMRTKVNEKNVDGESQSRVSAVVRRGVNDLQALRGVLKETSEFERGARRTGMGSAGSGMRLSMLQNTVNNTIDTLNDLSDSSENAGVSIEEMAREINEDQQ